MKEKKIRKIPVVNEKGQIVRKCPKCRSSRLFQAENKGFFCKNCGFVNQRRYGSKEEIGKVTFTEY